MANFVKLVKFDSCYTFAMFLFTDRKYISELWHQYKSATQVIQRFKRSRGVKSIARTTVIWLVNKCEATGSINNRKKGVKTKRNPVNVLKIKEKMLEINASQLYNIHQLTKETGISCSTTWRIITNDLKLFSYRFIRKHKLEQLHINHIFRLFYKIVFVGYFCNICQ